MTSSDKYKHGGGFKAPKGPRPTPSRPKAAPQPASRPPAFKRSGPKR
jgi:hypothetical protein